MDFGRRVNYTDDISLIEIEVDKEEVFRDMSDFMILNYCYKQDENGYSIYPASDYSKLVEEDYKIITSTIDTVPNATLENIALYELTGRNDNTFITAPSILDS